MSEDFNVPPVGFVEDEIVLKIVQNLCKVANVSLEEVADLFGDYWANVYSQRIYKVFYDEARNAKDFILKLDRVHWLVTRNIPYASPPRFDY